MSKSPFLKKNKPQKQISEENKRKQKTEEEAFGEDIGLQL